MSEAQRVRVWPGVVAAALLSLLFHVVPRIAPAAALYALGGALLCVVAVLVWWLFFSRLPWVEKVGGLVLAALGIWAARFIVHKSIAGGMMGMMLPINAVPAVCVALAAWTLIQGRMSAAVRRFALAGLIAVACGGWALLRTDGIDGEGHSQFAWRWTPDAEELLLSVAAPESPKAPEPSKAVEAPKVEAAIKPEGARSVEIAAEWPGFRGPLRDGVVRGVQIDSDWATSAPAEAWRRPVGPGWSSFAVGGGLLYTQEQRGEFELVSCYRVTTGAPVWAHKEQVRFWESNAGAGPRGTPTLDRGRVYAFGATGILSVLDARTGQLVWKKDVAREAGVKVPDWGFSSSPLVLEDRVIVAASGRLVGYERETGEKRWELEAGKGSYGSPQLMELEGRQEMVFLSGFGATAVAPTDGKVLWKYGWEGAAMLQPASTGDGGLLLTTGGNTGGEGTRRIAVSGGKAEEKWTSRGLKPYFNDLVVHKGHAYGFDGGILSCITLENGDRKWKGGRYGYGQMLLLAEQDLLLVLSEEGDVALVAADPAGYREVGKIKAIEGKTWNHPVVAEGFLLVRNGQEMAAFRLRRTGSGS